MATGDRHQMYVVGRADLSESAEAGAAREEKNAGEQTW